MCEGLVDTRLVDAQYRKAGIDGGTPLAGCRWCPRPARHAPLLINPGSAWGYGVSTDVLGRLIELWTGTPIDVAMEALATGPLGMIDTCWHVDPGRAGRPATH